MGGAEDDIRALYLQGSVDAAITLAVETYGAEVYGFSFRGSVTRMSRAMRSRRPARILCASLRSFEWRCSVRTWFYKLARSAASKETRGPLQRARRAVPLSQVSELADRISTRTRDYLRTEVKDGFAALRETLAPDDQTLLILRVDRQLEWIEVAEVLSERPLEADEASRAAARLRQRFKSVKEDLRRRAIDAGLIRSDDAS